MANDLPDFLSDFDEQKETKPNLPSTQKKSLADPLARIPQREAKKAQNPQGHEPSMAGKQLRRGVLIPPEMDEEINRLVAEYGIGKMELMRYLLAAGLERVHTHGLDNDLKEMRAIKLQMPEWKSD